MESFHGTTIVSVRRGAAVALGGDGQVTLGNIIVKQSARKVRRLYHDQILAGFAGATADAFTLFERFEAKLEKHQGHLVRSAVELAQDWRTDRILRRRNPSRDGGVRACARRRQFARGADHRWRRAAGGGAERDHPAFGARRHPADFDQ